MSFWKKEIHLFGRREKVRGTVLVPWALYTDPKPMPEEELEALYAEVEARPPEPERVEVPPEPRLLHIVPEPEPEAAGSGFAAPPELLDPPPFPIFAPRHTESRPPEPEPAVEPAPEPAAEAELDSDPEPDVVHQPEFGLPPADPVWGRYEPSFTEHPPAEADPDPEPEYVIRLEPDPAEEHEPVAEQEPETVEPGRWIAPWSSVDLDTVDPEPEEPLAPAAEYEIEPVSFEPEPEPVPSETEPPDREPVSLEPAPADVDVPAPWSTLAPAEPIFPIFGAPDPVDAVDPADPVDSRDSGDSVGTADEPDVAVPFFSVAPPVETDPADADAGSDADADADAGVEEAVEPKPLVAFVASAPEAAPDPDPVEPELPPAAKTPLLKREIHFRRPKGESKVEAAKPAREKAERKKTKREKPEPATTKVKAPKVKAEKRPKAPKQRRPKRVKDTRPRQSIWERNLSMPRLRGRHAASKIVGLRVGSSQLAAAHVANNGSIELLQLARTPLRPGLVVGGEVREPDALAKEIKAFFSRSKLPSRNVRLGIASNRIGVRILEVPAIADPKAFGNAIRFRAQEALPIPVTDAVLDHVVLGEYAGEGGSTMNRVLVAFAHRDLVGRHAEACRKAGLKLAGVDLDAFALLRSVAEPLPEGAEPTHAIVAVAVGHERTIFAVSDGRICDFVRVLEWGGGVLDDALARALGVPVELAHEAKHQLALSGEVAAPGGLTPVQVEAARAAVRGELRVLGQEIVSSLRYYQTRPGSLAIGEVLVTGGGSELQGLAEELESIVGAPVRTGDPLSRLSVSKKVKWPAEVGSYAVAIGLGIE